MAHEVTGFVFTQIPMIEIIRRDTKANVKRGLCYTGVLTRVTRAARAEERVSVILTMSRVRLFSPRLYETPWRRSAGIYSLRPPREGPEGFRMAKDLVPPSWLLLIETTYLSPSPLPRPCDRLVGWLFDLIYTRSGENARTTEQTKFGTVVITQTVTTLIIPFQRGSLSSVLFFSLANVLSLIYSVLWEGTKDSAHLLPLTMVSCQLPPSLLQLRFSLQ